MAHSMPNTTPMEAQKILGSSEFTKEIDHSRRDFFNIGKQMLETSYTLSLRQLFKITLKLKKYLWQKLKLKKTQNVSRATIKKQVGSSIPKVGIGVVSINNHMAVIQV
jgi:hypothetical protein